MRFCILFIHKVDVIGADNLNVIFPGKLQQLGIRLLLKRIGFVVGTGNSGFMALKLQIVIIAKQILIPAYSFFCLFQLAWA